MFIQGLKRTWRDTWHAPDQVDIVALPLSIHTMCSDVTSSKQEPRAKGYGGLIPQWGKVGYGMLWCNPPVTIESPKIPKASGKLPEFPLAYWGGSGASAGVWARYVLLRLSRPPPLFDSPQAHLQSSICNKAACCLLPSWNNEERRILNFCDWTSARSALSLLGRDSRHLSCSVPIWA